MKELALMIAHILPEEKIIDELDKAIQKYKEDPTHENTSGVETFALLLISKKCSTGPDGIVGALKEMENVEKAHNLFNRVEKQ